MATEALAAAAADRPVRPYPPSWLNRLIGWIEGLPGPTWAAYVALGLLSVAFSNAQAWASGQVPSGTFAPDLTYWGVFLVALLWMVDYLDEVAVEAFDRFRPALELHDDEVAALRYRLTVLPATPAWLATICVALLTPAYYVLDPEGSKVMGLSAVGLALRAISEVFSSAVLLLIVLQLVRQLRMVTAIVAAAPRIDLFQPGPLYAFSRLTSRTAIALAIFIGTSTYVAAPPSDSSSALLLWAPWIIGIPAFAVAAFVLPFVELHARLVREKERLQADAEGRLRGLLQTINREVDAGDLSRADQLNKTLASLLQERDVVARLPTWPWSPGTLRAIMTAIALPLLLFLAQRVLSQVL